MFFSSRETNNSAVETNENIKVHIESIQIVPLNKHWKTKEKQKQNCIMRI